MDCTWNTWNRKKHR